MGKKKRKHRYFHNYLKIGEVFENLEYKRLFKIEHPNFFYPNGITVFCGGQGSGKTMSANRYIKQLLEEFPHCIVCSNVPLEYVPSDRFFPYEGMQTFGKVINGEEGVIYFLDEMHLEYNSLESKGMPVGLFEVISQQRKQRIHIVGTAQVFTRLAKPFREQIDQIVICNNIFGLDMINYNQVCKGETLREMKDGTLSARVVNKYFLLHGPTLYNQYDSFEVVHRMANDVVKRDCPDSWR